jgi:hypothetical protein
VLDLRSLDKYNLEQCVLLIKHLILIMKKLLLLFVMGTVASAHSQTIDAEDFPSQGDVPFTFGSDADVSNLTLDLGTTGAGQTYDFSSLETDELIVVGFYDPSTVTNGADFPEADMAVDQSGAYGFIDTTSNKVEVIGLGGDLGPLLGSPIALELSIPATNPWTIFTFPSSLGTAFADTAVFQAKVESSGLVPAPFNLAWDPDSVEVKRVVYIESLMDASGTLTNPLGETHSVLRMTLREITIDSIWGYNADIPNDWSPSPSLLGFPRVDTVYRTRFLSEELGYYVVEFETAENGVPESSAFISNASQCCTSIEEVVASGQTVLYPNPTSDNIRIRTGGDIYQLNIMDMSGKLLQSEQLTIDGQTVELNGLANGLYVYQMLDEAGKMAHTGRFSVIK